MAYSVLLQRGKKFVGMAAFETLSRTVQFAQDEAVQMAKFSNQMYNHANDAVIKADIVALKRGDQVVIEGGEYTLTVMRAIAGPAVKTPTCR